MSARTGFVKRLANVRALIVIALVLVYAAGATYYVMADTSVRGLTVRAFYVSRFCTSDTGITDQVVNYEVQASVWSTQSIRTSLTNIQFTLVTSLGHVATASGNDALLDPGKGASFTLVFKDDSLDPHSLPRSQDLILSITATVSAGLVKATLTRSHSLSRDFGSTSC